ncbi:calcium-binding protein [Rhizorhabdus dicambivorans]|uniref:Hemolysin-type calcium-binding protein n=1 Tax=Rhizorhabdus dicambivorans TaxID=1850238 RepID=A0A2A4FZ79_9SPHN|nr:calcium-binding protein [Rhizorhabdus dicambivorans]ATE65912.1 hemolysin-type calcium-binding protein [Rhizorhabdus dicambivorans]PCE43028.1 hemolysin-type calcium-binding protein [Rhizorhabdus dicambivorans]
MAQVSGGTVAAIRMDQIDVSDLIQGDPIENSSITLSFDKGHGNILTLRGVSFTYDDFDRLDGGQLFLLDLSAGGETLLNVTGLTTLASRFTKLAREDNDAGALGVAFGGDDMMQGTGFDDFLNGFGGHDNLYGGAGADTLQGGAGNDHIYGRSAEGGVDGDDRILGEDGNDYLQGNAGNDTLDGGAGVDRIQGGQGNDSASGGAGNDSINGNLGNDTLDGGDGNDLLRGGQGNDSLSGGIGNDTLSGDLGVDTLRGGSGADRFVFTSGTALFAGAGPDVVSDFANGSDKFDLGFRVAAVLSAGRQGSVASAADTAQTLLDNRAGLGEVAALTIGSDTYLFYSSTGGATVDSAVRVIATNATSIDLNDFV